jgi:hypothetical protein
MHELESIDALIKHATRERHHAASRDAFETASARLEALRSERLYLDHTWHVHHARVLELLFT